MTPSHTTIISSRDSNKPDSTTCEYTEDGLPAATYGRRPLDATVSVR